MPPAKRGWFSSNCGFGEPSSRNRQSKNREIARKPVRSTLEELLGDDLIGIDVGTVHRRDEAGEFGEGSHGAGAGGRGLGAGECGDSGFGIRDSIRDRFAFLSIAILGRCRRQGGYCFFVIAAAASLRVATASSGKASRSMLQKLIVPLAPSSVIGTCVLDAIIFAANTRSGAFSLARSP